MLNGPAGFLNAALVFLVTFANLWRNFMRKTLLAAAIAGLLAPSFVQAQSANVTLYGALILDTEVIIRAKQDATSGTPGTAPSGATGNYYRVSSNASRIGVRGTESLGGGLNAIFQLEQQPDASNSG